MGSDLPLRGIELSFTKKIEDRLLVPQKLNSKPRRR